MVDIDTQVEALHRVAEEIVATIKLNPKWYGGDYRVLFTDTGPGFKMQVAIYYNISGNGELLFSFSESCQSLLYSQLG
jgi:hypothetical protein